MRSLGKVQKLFRILKVISTIIFVCCIIGFVFSIMGLIGVASIGRDSGTWAEINKAVETTNITFEMCMCYCIIFVLMCAGETALYYYVTKFYKKELEIGTPFSKEVVREMKKIALLHVAIPFGIAFISMIITLAFNVDVSLSGLSGLGMGLVYLALSFVFDYGADLREIEIATVKIKEEVQNGSQNGDAPTIVVEPQTDEKSQNDIDDKPKE